MPILRTLMLPAAFAAAIILPVASLAQQTAPPAPASGSQTPGGWQGQGQGHGHRGGGMMHMMQDLNLSDQQKTQIQSIMQNFRQSHQGERPDAQAREQLRNQIMAVLTPQQRQQFQAKMQQMRQERGDRPDTQSTPQP